MVFMHNHAWKYKKSLYFLKVIKGLLPCFHHVVWKYKVGLVGKYKRRTRRACTPCGTLGLIYMAPVPVATYYIHILGHWVRADTCKLLLVQYVPGTSTVLRTLRKKKSCFKEFGQWLGAAGAVVIMAAFDLMIGTRMTLLWSSERAFTSLKSTASPCWQGWAMIDMLFLTSTSLLLIALAINGAPVQSAGYLHRSETTPL
jgi:hypothetical protein